MAVKYQIKLKAKEKSRLNATISKGICSARKITRCRVLLLVDSGQSKSAVSRALQIDYNTVRNICRRYSEEGLDAAIDEKPRSGAPTLFDGKARAKITALACTNAPEGYSQWSLRLLADKAVELGIVETISHNHVREILKKTK